MPLVDLTVTGTDMTVSGAGRGFEDSMPKLIISSFFNQTLKLETVFY